MAVSFKRKYFYLNIPDNIDGTAYSPHGKIHMDAFDSFIIPRIDTGTWSKFSYYIIMILV